MAQEQVIIEFIGDTEKLKSSFNELIQLQTKSAGLSEQQAADFTRANQDMVKALGQTTTALNSALVQTKMLADSFKDIGKAIVSANLADAAKDLKQISDRAADLTEKSKKLNTELADAKQKSDDLAKAGKQNTDAYKEQSAAVDKLAKDIDALSQQMAKLGSQSKAISGLVGIAKVTAKGFEEASATAKLFGSSAEQVELALTKLNQAIKVLNGLQEIEKALTEQGAAYKLIENGQRIAGAAATQLQSAAESEYTVVRWAAVAAQTALNAVMEANPVLLLVGAVGALGGAMLAFSDDAGKATEAQKKFNEEVDKEQQRALEIDVEWRKENKVISEFQAERLKLKIDHEQKIKALEEEVKKEGEERTKGFFQSIGRDEEMYQLDLDRNTEEARKKHLEQYIYIDQEYDKKKDIIDIKEAEDKKKKAEAAAKEALEEEIAALQLKQSKVGKATTDYYAYIQQIVDKENQLIKLDLVAGKNDKQIQLAIENNKKQLTDYKAWLNDFNAQNAQQVANAGQKSANGAKARDRQGLNDQIDELERQRLENDKYSDKDVSLYGGINDLKKKLAEIDAVSKESQDLQIAKLEQDTKNYQNQSIAFNQQFLAKKRDDADKAAQTEATDAITANKAILDNDKSTAEQKKAAQVAIDKANVELRNKELKDEQDYYDKAKKALEAANQSTEQLTLNHNSRMATLAAGKETAQAQLNADSTTTTSTDKPLYHIDDKNIQLGLQAAQSLAQKTADSVFQIENDSRNAKFNAEIANLQKISQFELNNRNLTEAQKAAIQKKFDRQQAAIKLQQWKADQKAKEEQAVINGALAITEIFASTPDPTGIFLAIKIAAAVATTAAQVAVIASQKPPQFAKGTPAGMPSTPPGMKLVGEQGPELIYTPGGERIITAPDTAALLAKYAIPQMPVVPDFKTGDFATGPAMPAIDYNKLGKSVAEALKANPQTHVSLDKTGFTSFIIEKGSKREYVNNKFSA